MRSHSKTRKISPQSWDDFKGPYKLETDNSPININVELPLEISRDTPIEWDKLAKQHAGAFQRGEITRERLASILELRSIMEIGKSMTITSLENLSGLMRPHFLRNVLPEDMEKTWQNEVLNRIPKDECFYTEVNIPIETMNDSRLFDLFIFAYQLGIVYIKNINNVTNHREHYPNGMKVLTFYIPSVTARNALAKIAFGQNAKPLVARVGELSIDDIECSVRNNMRYGVFAYPDVKDMPEFHGISAPAFYISLHDEVHRRLMSSIPNKALTAYLTAIDLVRDVTGIFWSDDIWNAVDLEIGDFNNMFNDFLQSEHPKDVTRQFEILLEANKFSNKERIGLFTPGYVYLDTLFILLIDMVENEDKWKKLGIEKQYFTNDAYKNYITHVETEINNIRNHARADQVAHLITKWLSSKDPVVPADYTFPSGCRFEKIDGYLQVTSKGEIIANESKAQQIAADYLKVKIQVLNDIIERQRNTNLTTNIVEIKTLNDKAKMIIEVVNEQIKPETTISTVKLLTEITETTGYLLTNPSNTFLQKKYSDILCGHITLPKKVMAALRGFLSALLDLAKSAEHRNNKVGLISSKVRFFEEGYASERYKNQVGFLQLARVAPPSY